MGPGSGQSKTPQNKNQDQGGGQRHQQQQQQQGLGGQGQGHGKGQGSQEKRKILLNNGGANLTVSVPGSAGLASRVVVGSGNGGSGGSGGNATLTVSVPGSGSGIASRLGVRGGSGRNTTQIVSVPRSGSGIASRLGVRRGPVDGNRLNRYHARDPRLNKKQGHDRGQKRRATVSPIRFIKDDDVQILVNPISAPKGDQPQLVRRRSIKLSMEEFMAQDPVAVYPCPRKNSNLLSPSTRTRTVPANFSYFLDTEEKPSSSSTTSQPQSANWLMSFANNSSFGSFVPTDSRYGNSLFPALPRLDSKGNFVKKLN